MENTNVAFQNAVIQERNYCFSRTALIGFGAFTGGIVLTKIGFQLANSLLPEHDNAPIIFGAIAVIFGFVAIDMGLLNALISISNTKKDEFTKAPKSIWTYALVLAILAISVSFIANNLMVDFMSGESKLEEANRVILDERENLEEDKNEAKKIIKSAKSEEDKLIKKAISDGNALIQEAVASATSESHKQDYDNAKDNRQNWFWICKEGSQGCPIKYVAYRNRILAAESKKKAMVLEASLHEEYVREEQSTTLSKTLEGDSLLLTYLTNISELEKERKSKKHNWSFILFALTLGCYIGSFSLTFVLRDHRRKHGQYIEEDNARPLIYITDYLSRLFSIFFDIIYNLTVAWMEKLREKEWFKTQELGK